MVDPQMLRELIGAISGDPGTDAAAM